MYLPEGVKIDTRKVRFNVIKGALNDIKCTQTQNDNSARIVWFDGFTPPQFFLTLYPHQRINRIPSMHIMCYKNSTFNAFNKMKNINKDLFNFFPHTYLLPEQLAKFKSDAEAISKREAQKKSTKQPNPDSDPTTWIFKPKSGQCGIGIQLFQDCKQITAQYSGIVQNYIAPHLIDGFKFDFRMYVFIPTLDPLTIFIYKEGLARFCSGKYVKPNSQNMNDLYIHLTNTSVNVKNQDAHNEILQLFSTVFRRIGKPELWMKIKKVAALSIIAQYHSIVSHVDEEEKLLQKTTNFMNPPEETSNIPKLGKFQRYFHLVGLDILINDKYEPIVLEMNDRPSMFVTSQEIEKDLKTGIVKDMLQMVTLDGSQPTKESRFGKWEQVFPMPGDPEFNKTALDSLRRSLPQSSYPSFLQPATQPPPKQQNQPPEMKKDNEETPKTETESVETKGNDESNQIEISISAEIQTVQPNDTQQIKNQNSQTKIGNNSSVRSSTNQIHANKPEPKQNVTTKSQQLKGTRKLQPKPKEVKTVEPDEKEADKAVQQLKPKQTVKSTMQQKPKEAAATQQQQKPKETAKPSQQPKQKAPTKSTQKPKARNQKKQQIPKESIRNSKEILPPNKQEKEPIDNQPKQQETTETKHQQNEKEVTNQPKVSHNQQQQTEMIEPNDQSTENEITTQQTSNNQHQVSNNQATQKETITLNNQPKENETAKQQASNNQHQVSNNQQKQTEITTPNNQSKEKEASIQQNLLNNQQRQTTNQLQVSNNQQKTKNENNSKPKPKDTTQKPKEQNKPLNQVKRETTTVVSQANRVVTDEKATEIIITYSTGTHLKSGNKMMNSIKRQQQALKAESDNKQPTESFDKKKTITPKLENKAEPSIDHEKIKTIPKEKLPPLETDKHEVIEKEPMISITTSLPHLDHQ